MRMSRPGDRASLRSTRTQRCKAPAPLEVPLDQSVQRFERSEEPAPCLELDLREQGIPRFIRCVRTHLMWLSIGFESV